MIPAFLAGAFLGALLVLCLVTLDRERERQVGRLHLARHLVEPRSWGDHGEPMLRAALGGALAALLVAAAGCAQRDPGPPDSGTWRPAPMPAGEINYDTRALCADARAAGLECGCRPRP